MTEHNATSGSEESSPFPPRHGAPWDYQEFLALAIGIKYGLTATQLAKVFQRTSASINGAAKRLIPTAAQPKKYTQALEVLVRYLQEHSETELNALVQAICQAPIMSKDTIASQDLVTQPLPLTNVEESKTSPARHGAPWLYMEFFDLANAIKYGLTLPQLSLFFQRTCGSINGAAMRLIPSAIKPENYSDAVEVLAHYLRDNEEFDLHSLVQVICSKPIIPKSDASPPTRASQSTPDDLHSEETKKSRPLPARHGARWEYLEFLELANGVKYGLTATQLAKVFHRTPGSINGAVLRLIPSAEKPENHSHALDVLARYLRDNKDIDLHALVKIACPTSVTKKE